MSVQTIPKMDIDVTDEQLMIEVQKRDRDAFNKLVLRYHEDAVRLAYYYVKNWEDARDLSQDAFIKVYNQSHSFDAAQAFRPWFFRILVNHVLNFVNRKKRIRFFTFTDYNRDNEQPVEEMVPDQNDQESSFYNKQLIWDALEKLSTNHRSVLILYEIEGLKENEISKVMNCSVGTVKSRLHYAREKMRKILADDNMN